MIYVGKVKSAAMDKVFDEMSVYIAINLNRERPLI
jgi:hypothetical protein